MTDFVIGDEDYNDDQEMWDNQLQDERDEEDEKWASDEINTSYDQNKPIGGIPTHYPAAGAEPIDAKTGQDFLDIDLGEENKEFKTVWQELGYGVEGRPSYDEDAGIVWNSLGFNIKETILRNNGINSMSLNNGESINITEIAERDWDEIDYNTREKIKKEVANFNWSAYEKLNKDGTGVARATRGVNPNKAKHKVLRFEYVSNSDCPICKEFDGKTYSIDSDERPIIPRLESQGGKGGRPYTHPNCKCVWRNVFQEAVTAKDYDRASKWYGKGFEELTQMEKKMAIIDMLKSSLGMEKAGEAYKIQKILDDVVDNTYGKEKSKESNDDSINEMFKSVAEIIIKQKKKTLGMESKANEYDGNMPTLPHSAYGEPWQSSRFMMDKPLGVKVRELFQQGFDMTNDEIKSGMFGLNENMSVEEMASILSSKAGYEGANEYGVKGVSGKSGLESHWKVKCPECGDYILEFSGGGSMLREHLHRDHDWSWEDSIKASEGGNGSGKSGHKKWMLTGEADSMCDNCMIQTEKDDDGKCVLCQK